MSFENIYSGSISHQLFTLKFKSTTAILKGYTIILIFEKVNDNTKCYTHAELYFLSFS